MADVVAHTGLAPDEIAAIHSAPTYPVYALGSHPGYAISAAWIRALQRPGARCRC